MISVGIHFKGVQGGSQIFEEPDESTSGVASDVLGGGTVLSTVQNACFSREYVSAALFNDPVSSNTTEGWCSTTRHFGVVRRARSSQHMFISEGRSILQSAEPDDFAASCKKPVFADARSLARGCCIACELSDAPERNRQKSIWNLVSVSFAINGPEHQQELGGLDFALHINQFNIRGVGLEARQVAKNQASSWWYMFAPC